MLYKNEYLHEISFPLGGIGTGSIGLSGNGALIDWEIFNRPNKGFVNQYSFFAVRAEYPDGSSVSKLLRGDFIGNLTGQYLKTNFIGFGHGPLYSTVAALPHFKNVVFDGRFPIATLTFTDDKFPAEVVMEAFNPFIPHDADSSGIPLAFFNIRIKSRVDGVKYTVGSTLNAPFPICENTKTGDKKLTSVTLKYANKSPDELGYGDLTLATSCDNAFVQEYWYRGTWRDNITTFWHEFSTGTLHERHYDTPAGNDICTVGAFANINCGEEQVFPFSITWNFPNCHNYWSPYKKESGEEYTWKNYYATKFENSLESARYTFENIDYLYGKTKLFCDTLHGSTLDPAVIDAVTSTMSVLKSSTVLRLEDGTFYGWEGTHELSGSCEGTCTHVWSYAYALCFLFPELERSIRDTEFNIDTAPDGKMAFRTLLPLCRERWDHRACVDGQMASVFKAYREWKVCGDREWLEGHWAKIKSVLEYAWSPANPDAWDKDCDGVLEGRQHHTLDMELFGPSAWLEGMYLAALKAASEMADFLGDFDAKEKYTALFESGYKYTAENLFNSEYFIQKVDISSSAPTEKFNCPEYWNSEKGELKYQFADGCAIDQLLGQWHANILGLGDIFDKDQRKTALKSMFKYLYKDSFREFVNPWRVYAIDDESGTLLCAYPDGVRRPILPAPYTDECWTGLEYAFAGLLISEGLKDEGLKVIRSTRARYNGKNRNPYNEIECGSNYARAMSAFALLPIFSGFEFDMSNGHIGFSPIEDGDFRTFWSLGASWGSFSVTDKNATLSVLGAPISLSSISLGKHTKIKGLFIDKEPVEFDCDGAMLTFAPRDITSSLEVVL